MSGVRAFYVTCDTPAWYEIAARMQQRHQWNPVYWINEPVATEMLQERFPGVITHSRYDAYHLVSPPTMSHLGIEPLDTALLEAVSEEQIVAIKMADVIDSVDAFGFNDRRRFFHQRLRYWRSVLLAIKPDVALFGFSPHVVYDYAIYVCCRRMNIRTLMFEATFNLALLFTEEDPMVGSTLVAKRYAELLADPTLQDVTLPPYCEEYLTRVRSPYSTAMPWYMRDQFKTFPRAIRKRLYQGDQAARLRQDAGTASGRIRRLWDRARARVRTQA